MEDKINKANEQINKIVTAIKEQGYPHSIVFAAREIPKEESELLSEESKEKAQQILDGTSFMEGDAKLLHVCVTSLFTANDTIYGFFASAVDAARTARNKNNPNVN
jgi:hypothetical protein